MTSEKSLWIFIFLFTIAVHGFGCGDTQESGGSEPVQIGEDENSDDSTEIVIGEEEGSGKDNSGGESQPSFCQADGPTKFTPAPDRHSLPPARCGEPFDGIAAESDVTYELLDITSDGYLDLVVFADECSEAVGRDYWHVYPGEESGFENQPIEWQLPAARCGEVFDSSSKAGSASINYNLMNIRGKGLELVVTEDDCTDAVGRDHWHIYPAKQNGFARQPVEWGLPPARCGEPFDRLAKNGSVTYSLLDLTTDGRPELVVYSDECHDAVGDNEWHVYSQGTGGFEKSPDSWSLPPSRCGVAFDSQTKSRGDVQYGLHALGGEGMDLVVYSDECNDAVGTSQWHRYPSTGGGFEKAPGSVSIPPARCGVAFDRSAKTGDVSYSLQTLGCARRPGLLVTDDECHNAVGNSEWHFYPLESSNEFQSTPDSISIPPSRCGDTFNSTSASGGELEFSLLQLDSTTRPALAVFQDECDSAVGTSHWHKYRLE